MKIKPRLFTVGGCRQVATLLQDQMREFGLGDVAALVRWILARVELPDDGPGLTPSTLRKFLAGTTEKISPETLEILCASGIFAPKTRDQIWAIACEMPPKDEGGSENNSLPPIELLERAMAQVGQALQTLRGVSTATPMTLLPTSREQAIAVLQAILTHNYPGWTAQEISDHLRYDGFAYVTPAEVELWIQGQALLSNEGRSALALEKHRPQLPWGGPATDRWLTHCSEAFWARRPPTSSNAGTSIDFNGSLV